MARGFDAAVQDARGRLHEAIEQRKARVRADIGAPDLPVRLSRDELRAVTREVVSAAMTAAGLDDPAAQFALLARRPDIAAATVPGDAAVTAQAIAARAVRQAIRRALLPAMRAHHEAACATVTTDEVLAAARTVVSLTELLGGDARALRGAVAAAYAADALGPDLLHAARNGADDLCALGGAGGGASAAEIGAAARRVHDACAAAEEALRFAAAPAPAEEAFAPRR